MSTAARIPQYLRDAISSGREEWREDALCRETDPDIFFPDNGGGGWQAREARATCRDCSVQVQCLETALETGEEFGIWGGHTAAERDAMRRKKRA